MLGQGDEMHVETDCSLDDILELVFGVARAELSGMGVHCERHVYCGYLVLCCAVNCF